MPNKRLENFTVVFAQSEIKGTITAHLLECDLVSQGGTYLQAFKNLETSYDVIAEHDAKTGYIRKPAPPECWPTRPRTTEKRVCNECKAVVDHINQHRKGDVLHLLCNLCSEKFTQEDVP